VAGEVDRAEALRVGLRYVREALGVGRRKTGWDARRWDLRSRRRYGGVTDILLWM
jgi:hypothetical protein